MNWISRFNEEGGRESMMYLLAILLGNYGN